ncbi:MAG TPA: hypothetical protein VI997_10125 [Candidatus Thermoplasmatota archaeon]|nr:hypothetical protein [Candidatus Thermoplasmatota archaeon]
MRTVPLPRTAIAIVMLTALPLTGCIGADDPAADGLATANTTGSGDVSNVAPDGRKISAFDETNRTEAGLGGREHSHDYWAGRDRVDIMSGEYGMIPFPLVPGDGYAPATAIVDWQPPPPNIVFEGTAHIEFLLNDVRHVYTGPGGTPVPGAPELPSVQHAAVHFSLKYITPKEVPGDWRDAGAVVPGTPLIIPVRSDEVDMPHAIASLWVFRLYTDEANEVEFNMTITIVHGEDVEEWPGHPDFYADRTSRVVFDQDTQTKAFGAHQFLVTGDDTTWNHPQKLISYGTEQLDVFVNITRADSPVEPTGFFLDYHNASIVPGIQTFDPGQNRVYDSASDGSTFHFVVPVDTGGMDSPYMPSSRWGFRVLAEFSNEVVQGCGNREAAGFTIGTSCFPYSVDYHMSVIASGRSTALGVANMTADGGT